MNDKIDEYAYIMTLSCIALFILIVLLLVLQFCINILSMLSMM